MKDMFLTDRFGLYYQPGILEEIWMYVPEQGAWHVMELCD